MKQKKKALWKTARYIALFLLLFVVLSVSVYAAMIQKGMSELKKPVGSQGQGIDFSTKEILWNGDVYEYREDLITILCLGIDGREEARENTAIGFGPRADSIYLAVVDLEQKELKLLNISRDSMAEIRLRDSLGQEAGFCEMQLGLQYAIGDGLEGSCHLMEEAVSKMLGIPIHGSCALYWKGVGEIHEVLGPVTVEVSKELHELDSATFEEAGLTELTGEQALVYVQGRDIQVEGSNGERTERQKEYMQALYGSAREKLKRNPLMVFSLWHAVEEYFVTDLAPSEIQALATLFCQLDMDELEIRSFSGSYVFGEFQDELWLDEEEKLELLIEVFYKKRY